MWATYFSYYKVIIIIERVEQQDLITNDRAGPSRAPVVHTTKLRDDEDAASVGSDDTDMKPLPQADEYGNLENLPSKDGQKKVRFIDFHDFIWS